MKKIKDCKCSILLFVALTVFILLVLLLLIKSSIDYTVRVVDDNTVSVTELGCADCQEELGGVYGEQMHGSNEETISEATQDYMIDDSMEHSVIEESFTANSGGNHPNTTPYTVQTQTTTQTAVQAPTTTQTTTQTAVQAPTTTQVTTQALTEHVHSYVTSVSYIEYPEEGHYEEVCVREGYEEKVYESYDAYCYECGTIMDGWSFDQLLDHSAMHGAYGSYTKVVDVIWHEPVYEERWIVDREAYCEEVIEESCIECGYVK